MPLLEIARMPCLPDQGNALAAGLAKGAQVIGAHSGCLAIEMQRGFENPDEFVPRSPEFRSHMAEACDPETVAEAHYSLITWADDQAPAGT